MYEEDEELLDEFAITRNLKTKTRTLYKNALKKYTKFNGLSFTELLEEAEQEEDDRVPWRKTKLRKRLLKFRIYLYEKHMTSTAKFDFNRILTIYRHFEISFQKLPPISEKNSNESNLKFKDMLTKDIIRDALKLSDPLMESLILFESSSGCSTAETLSLKVGDLIVAVEDYYHATNIQDLIDNLKDRDDIVPTFQLRRPKTGKEFYTFCTPEAFKSICFYLRTRKCLMDSDRLFKVTQLHLMQKFREINNIMGLGTTGLNNFVRFRSHMLRKFHATSLYNDGMSREIVNDLQGKAKNKVDSCYFVEDPDKLKSAYISHMNCLCINMDVTHLDIRTEEYKRLELELDRKNDEVNALNERLDYIERLINNNVDDTVRGIVNKYY